MDKLQRIRNQIRGWLPEPRLPQLQHGILTGKETKKGHLVGYSIDRELIPAYLILAAIGIASVIFNYRLISSMQTIWIILGIAVGLSFGSLITLKQLEFLAEQGEKRIISQTIVLTLVLLLLVFLVLVPENTIPANIRTGEYFLIWSIISAALISRSLLLYIWERKNHVRIHQNQFSTYFYLSKD